MINSVALHKLSKLRHSKMILIFIIACAVISLFTIFPVVIMGIVAGNVSVGAATASTYFGFTRFFGEIAALMLGATLWRQDEKDGTLLTFLARPLSRIEIYLGKVLGCVYALAIYLGAVVVFYLAAHLIFFRFALPLSFPLYLIQEFASYLVFMFAGAFFSSFVKPLMAATITLGWMFLYLLAKIFVVLPMSWAGIVAKVLKFITVDLNISYGISELLMADIPTISPLIKGIGYFLLWSLMLFCASVVLFNKREFAGRKS